MIYEDQVDEWLREDLESRFNYHSPVGDQSARYAALRALVKELAYGIAALCPPSRERSLALTKLEESSMWANAGVARHPEDGE